MARRIIIKMTEPSQQHQKPDVVVNSGAAADSGGAASTATAPTRENQGPRRKRRGPRGGAASAKAQTEDAGNGVKPAAAKG